MRIGAVTSTVLLLAASTACRPDAPPSESLAAEGLRAATSSCGEPEPGPWATHPIAVAGAATTIAPYTNDAGILAARNDIIPASDSNGDGELDSYTAVVGPYPIEGATITAVYYDSNPTDTFLTFVVEDVAGPILVYQADVSGIDSELLVPGTVVSFVADRVQDYFGLHELTYASGFSIDGTADVHVLPLGELEETPVDANVLYNIELWGEVDSASGCEDPTTCWSLSNESGSVLLVGLPEEAIGDCMHWLGPYHPFLGGSLQAEQWLWVTPYYPSYDQTTDLEDTGAPPVATGDTGSTATGATATGATGDTGLPADDDPSATREDTGTASTGDPTTDDSTRDDSTNNPLDMQSPSVTAYNSDEAPPSGVSGAAPCGCDSRGRRATWWWSHHRR